MALEHWFIKVVVCRLSVLVKDIPIQILTQKYRLLKVCLCDRYFLPCDLWQAQDTKNKVIHVSYVETFQVCQICSSCIGLSHQILQPFVVILASLWRWLWCIKILIPTRVTTIFWDHQVNKIGTGQRSEALGLLRSKSWVVAISHEDKD